MIEKCYTTRDTCRCCGSDRLEFVGSLGEQLVSDFVTEDKIHSGHKVPIELERCKECTLVQAKHTAPQDFLYTRQYWYRSGVTETMREALRDVVRCAVSRVKLDPGDVVLDIGSNDGTLLREYPCGLLRIGCEPAINLRAEGMQGIDCLIPTFWSADAFFDHQITRPEYRMSDGMVIPAEEKKKAKIVTACGMFYDMEDPNAFVADVAKVLHPEGIFVAQLMCLRQMLAIGDIGNLAHEHLEFYTLMSLIRLFRKHGLVIYDIEQNQVNGGSYRIYACHYDSGYLIQPTVERALWAEAEKCSVPVIKGFFTDMEENRKLLMGFIRSQVIDGKKVWILGASTKGNVIAQWLGLTPEWIGGASERSPEKVGKFMVGSGIHIHSEETARRESPDYFLVLPMAFIDEIKQRESIWYAAGGRFILPTPRMRIV